MRSCARRCARNWKKATGCAGVCGVPHRHVRNTVREWDGREMADQIELNIGKDLQAIQRERHDRGGVIGPGAAPADVRGRRQSP